MHNDPVSKFLARNFSGQRIEDESLWMETMLLLQVFKSRLVLDFKKSELMDALLKEMWIEYYVTHHDPVNPMHAYCGRPVRLVGRF